ncbi:MAG: hypothetical protein P1P65_02745 [Treponema sp.]
MALHTYGNPALSDIYRMKIAAIGFDAFLDTDFTPAAQEDRNLIELVQTLNSSEITDPQLPSVIDSRIYTVFAQIYNLLNTAHDSVMPIFGIPARIGFFDFLKDTIPHSNPGTIAQQYLIRYQLCRYIAYNFFPVYLSTPDGSIETDDIKIKQIQAFIECHFIKTGSGYAPAFGGKTDVPATWPYLKKILAGKAPVLRNMSGNTAAEFKNQYVMYYRLKQFEAALKPYIPPALLHRTTEQIAVLLQKLHNAAAEGTFPQCENGIEYLLICGVPESETFDPRFFEYEYGNNKARSSVREPLKSVLSLPARESLYQSLLTYSEHCIQSIRGGTAQGLDLIQTYRLLELYTAATGARGEDISFYAAWFLARIDYCRYLSSGSTAALAQSAAHYTAAFSSGCRFAGKQLEYFITESLTVLLEYYPTAQNTEAITAIYGWATSAGISVALFREFKAAGFQSSACNPFSVLIKLWDAGAALIHIASLTHLRISEVQEILRMNRNFLRREDAGELTRVIQSYEEEELSGGNILDRFDDF